jgi:hypothetical protein
VCEYMPWPQSRPSEKKICLRLVDPSQWIVCEEVDMVARTTVAVMVFEKEEVNKPGER